MSPSTASSTSMASASTRSKWCAKEEWEGGEGAAGVASNRCRLCLCPPHQVANTYLLSTGLPEDDPEHVLVMCAFAADLMDLCRDVPGVGAVHVRVGVHCGPVIAGVIGRSRRFYRVFGDTGEQRRSDRVHPRAPCVYLTLLLRCASAPAVNMASRMMSTGQEGRIHVSAAIAAAMTASQPSDAAPALARTTAVAPQHPPAPLLPAGGEPLQPHADDSRAPSDSYSNASNQTELSLPAPVEVSPRDKPPPLTVEPRGKTFVKGKGEIDTYWLVSAATLPSPRAASLATAVISAASAASALRPASLALREEDAGGGLWGGFLAQVSPTSRAGSHQAAGRHSSSLASHTAGSSSHSSAATKRKTKDEGVPSEDDVTRLPRALPAHSSDRTLILIPTPSSRPGRVGLPHQQSDRTLIHVPTPSSGAGGLPGSRHASPRLSESVPSGPSSEHSRSASRLRSSPWRRSFGGALGSPMGAVAPRALSLGILAPVGDEAFARKPSGIALLAQHYIAKAQSGQAQTPVAASGSTSAGFGGFGSRPNSNAVLPPRAVQRVARKSQGDALGPGEPPWSPRAAQHDLAAPGHREINSMVLPASNSCDVPGSEATVDRPRPLPTGLMPPFGVDTTAGEDATSSAAPSAAIAAITTGAACAREDALVTTSAGSALSITPPKSIQDDAEDATPPPELPQPVDLGAHTKFALRAADNRHSSAVSLSSGHETPRAPLPPLPSGPGVARSRILPTLARLRTGTDAPSSLPSSASQALIAALVPLTPGTSKSMKSAAMASMESVHSRSGTASTTTPRGPILTQRAVSLRSPRTKAAAVPRTVVDVAPAGGAFALPHAVVAGPHVGAAATVAPLSIQARVALAKQGATGRRSSWSSVVQARTVSQAGLGASIRALTSGALSLTSAVNDIIALPSRAESVLSDVTGRVVTDGPVRIVTEPLGVSIIPNPNQIVVEDIDLIAPDLPIPPGRGTVEVSQHRCMPFASILHALSLQRFADSEAESGLQAMLLEHMVRLGDARRNARLMYFFRFPTTCSCNPCSAPGLCYSGIYCVCHCSRCRDCSGLSWRH